MAPNHIFAEREIVNRLIEKLKKYITLFYGKNPINSENLSKLQRKQFAITLKLLKKYKHDKRILYGGLFSKKKMKISPTILKFKIEENNLIKKELFSSLLPIIEIDNEKSALKSINQNSKPLAIYIFGGNKQIHDNLIKLTSSGTVCINDVMLPVLIPNLPFGGVGKSGIGKFHGEEGFHNFSNQRSITNKSFWFDINLRYPPYNKLMKWIKLFFRI